MSKSLSTGELAEHHEIRALVEQYLRMRKGMKDAPPYLDAEDAKELKKIESHSTKLLHLLDELKPMARKHLDDGLEDEMAHDSLALTGQIKALGTAAAKATGQKRTSRSADDARSYFLRKLAETYARLTGERVKRSRSKPEQGAWPSGAFLDLMKALLASHRQAHGKPMPGFEKEGAPEVDMGDDGLDSAIRRAMESRSSK